MDWLICIAAGVGFGLLLAGIHVFSRWAAEARHDGAIK